MNCDLFGNLVVADGGGDDNLVDLGSELRRFFLREGGDVKTEVDSVLIPRPLVATFVSRGLVSKRESGVVEVKTIAGRTIRADRFSLPPTSKGFLVLMNGASVEDVEKLTDAEASDAFLLATLNTEAGVRGSMFFEAREAVDDECALIRVLFVVKVEAAPSVDERKVYRFNGDPKTDCRIFVNGWIGVDRVEFLGEGFFWHVEEAAEWIAGRARVEAEGGADYMVP